MATLEAAGDAGTAGHSDISQKSYSSIDDDTHYSLHARSKSSTKTSVLTKAVAIKRTVVTGEKRGITVSMSARRTKAKPVAAILPPKQKKSGLCCRVCLAALPFYFLILLLFLLPWLFQATSDDGFGCLRQNNYAFSLTPMLSYTNGPPPV